MTQASNKDRRTGREVELVLVESGDVESGAVESGDPDGRDVVAVVEHEFGTMMMNMTRYKHQINGSRVDRMALMVLGTLSHCGPSRLTAIAERTGFDASHVSRQVSDLEKAGLLAREADPDDRRAVLLRATDEGNALMQRLKDGRRSRVERLLEGWSADEIEIFGHLLGRLNEATERLQGQLANEIAEELNHG